MFLHSWFLKLYFEEFNKQRSNETKFKWYIVVVDSLFHLKKLRFLWVSRIRNNGFIWFPGFWNLSFLISVYNEVINIKQMIHCCSRFFVSSQETKVSLSELNKKQWFHLISWFLNPKRPYFCIQRSIETSNKYYIVVVDSLFQLKKLRFLWVSQIRNNGFI